MIGETIAHYEVLEKLGEGGMGVVYKALDTRLHRAVALKFLPAHLVANPLRIQRFEAEARAVSSLNHPNIATIHAMDEDAGRRFLVLEYLPGGTLRSRMDAHLAVGEAFPVGEAIRIMAAVADGLAHAHRNGVIHRDLKPENIMFTEEGVPRITDFGLAKSSQATEITTDGATVGTVPYIAPEQAMRGETSPRSDLFSFGIVIYEMLAGARPFNGTTDFCTLQAIVGDQPARLRQLRPDVPAGLERIVARLLEKEPDRRYQSAGDLASELYALAGYSSPRVKTGDGIATRTLTRIAIPTGRVATKRRDRKRWIAGAAACFAIAAAGGYGFYARMAAPGTIQLAVIPFTAASGSPDDAKFGEGIAEIVAARLAAIGPNVRVTPEADVLRQQVKDAAGANRAFGVRQVLTGEVHKAGDETRVDLRLVEARSGKTVAGGSITAAGTDLNDAIVREASALVGLPLDPLDALRLRVSNARTASPNDHYMLGDRYLQRYDVPGNIDLAVGEFQAATHQDPNYELGYAGLASAWWRAFQYLNDRNAIERAHQAATQALVRNEHLALPHVVLGAIAVQAGQVDAGIRELQKALELEPVSADACRELAAAYSIADKPAEAEATYKQAIRYSPDSWMGHSDLGLFYYKRARYAEAQDALNKAASLAPDNYIVYRSLGGVEMARGEWQAAEKHFRRAIDLRPWGSVYSNLGTLYIFMGRYAEAIPVLERAASSAGSARNAFAIWCNLGDAYQFAGGHEQQAIAAWRKAIAIGRDKLAISPDDPAQAAEIAVYEAKAGDMAQARSRIAAARSKAPKDGTVHFYSAIVAELDHRRKEALVSLQSALENGYSRNLIEREPELKKLRNDPAWQPLIARVKIARVKEEK